MTLPLWLFWVWAIATGVVLVIIAAYFLILSGIAAAVFGE